MWVLLLDIPLYWYVRCLLFCLAINKLKSLIKKLNNIIEFVRLDTLITETTTAKTISYISSCYNRKEWSIDKYGCENGLKLYLLRASIACAV